MDSKYRIVEMTDGRFQLQQEVRYKKRSGCGSFITWERLPSAGRTLESCRQKRAELTCQEEARVRATTVKRIVE